jgi:similar to stage IV sporulation protein
MKKWIGAVEFSASGGEAGRFFSQCRAAGLQIRQFCKNGDCLNGWILPKQYRKAAKIARKNGVRLRITQKRGLRFFIHRYRWRIGMFAGALIFLQYFVWAIDIAGCETVTPQQVLSALERNGLKKGVFLPNTDLTEIKLDTLTDLPQVAFLALNRIGSRIEVEVFEETPQPEQQAVGDDEPCNIIASKTAQIVSVEPYHGQAVVKPGSVVYQGDLLISGVVEGKDGKFSYHHADAKVLAKTSFIEEFSLALKQTEQIPTGISKTRYRIDLCGRKLPLFLATPLHGLWNSQTKLEQASLLGIPLPFGIETEQLTQYEKVPISFTEEEALALLWENAALFEEENLNGGQILSREPSAAVENGTLTLSIHYYALENIAVKQRLDVIP